MLDLGKRRVRRGDWLIERKRTLRGKRVIYVPVIAESLRPRLMTIYGGQNALFKMELKAWKVRKMGITVFIEELK